MNNSYQNDNNYDPKKLIKNNKDIFFIEMVKIREKMLENYLKINSKVVDLCCGSGAYLENVKKFTNNIIAVDSTPRYIDYINKNYPNVKTILSDATNLSKINNISVDLVFCYSSLYYIKDIEGVISEINRILKKEGIAILEFGNKYSLNSIISKKFEVNKNWATSYPVSYNKIKQILCKNYQFEIIEKRHFQITSYYGSVKKYTFLNILSHPFLQKIFCVKIKNKMIDEWISSFLPIFSFKKIFVVKK